MGNDFFSEILLNWYSQNKRDLPWRHSKDPYIIWLSEVILQQTRVDQGLPYYRRFIERFPNVTSLAEADEDEIFKLWQGLGYYNRARNLHTAAKQIVKEYKGKFPVRYEDVINLKGVGEYTAAAVMSFAYDEPYAVVDGNVYRVLSRVFGVEDFMDTSSGKKIFRQLADELLDRQFPGIYNQAIMDFGALQCVPSSPVCTSCPLIDKCHAYNYDKVNLLPVKKGKTTVRNRYFHYFDIRYEGNAFLRKRELKDIWSGLYEFPLIETKKELSFEELMRTKEYKEQFKETDGIVLKQSHSFKHILSHQVIYANFYQVEVSAFGDERFETVKEDSLHDYAVPKMIDNYLNKLQ